MSKFRAIAVNLNYLATAVYGPIRAVKTDAEKDRVQLHKDHPDLTTTKVLMPGETDVARRLNRRAFFAPIACAAVTALFPVRRLFAAGQDADPPVVTALDALGAVNDAIENAMPFASGTSQGLLELRYKSDTARALIASQMQAILGAIADAGNKAAQVTESERPFLRLGFPADPFGPLIDAVTRYRQFLVGALAPDALRGIRQAVAGERMALMRYPRGLGPEAAVLLTLAFAAEYGSAARLTPDRREMGQILDHYGVWVDLIAGSLPARRKVAQEAHDGKIGEIAQSPLSRRLGMGNFLLAGNQNAAKVAAPCVIFSPTIVNWGQLDGHDGLVMPNPQLRVIVDGTIPNVVLGRSAISVRDDAKFDARLISFKPGAAGNFAREDGFGFTARTDGEYCYITHSNVVLPAQEAFDRANALPSVKEDMQVRARIVAAVNNANACRVEIALCGKARQLLDVMPGILAFHRRYL